MNKELIPCAVKTFRDHLNPSGPIPSSPRQRRPEETDDESRGVSVFSDRIREELQFPSICW